MLTQEQLADMTASQRATLRENCVRALSGDHAADAQQLIDWLDELSAEAGEPKAHVIAWKVAEKGHHEGWIGGQQRFDLIHGPDPKGSGKAWAVQLDGKAVAHVRYVKEAKDRAEDEAEKLRVAATETADAEG
ncbi:hypothetical protein [Maricaulis sp. CAU 1757]